MHCLRCGKETVDPAVFCEECRKTVAVPLVESPYISTHIVLPNRSAPQPVKPVKKKEPKPKNKPLRRALFALFLCLVLCAAAVMGTLHYRKNYRSVRQQLADQSAKLSELESQTAELQEQAEFLETELVFVEWNGTRLFHVYGCDRLALKSFVAYSLETAQARGYQPCPACH